MRITQNQMVTPSVSVESTRSEQNKTIIGKTIEGVVTSVNGNKVSLTQNGQLLNLINDSTTLFEVNQKVQLMITGSKEGVLTAIPVTANGQENAASQALEKFGVALDTANREIVEAMLKFDVPLTKENFSTMKQNMTAAKAFINDIQMSPDKAALIEVDKSLKENVLNFIRLESEDQSAKSPLVQNRTPSSETLPDVLVNKPENLEEHLKENITLKSNDVVKNHNGIDTKIEGETNKLGQGEGTQTKGLESLNEKQSGELKNNEALVRDQNLGKTGDSAQNLQDLKMQEAIAKTLMKELVNILGDKPVEEFHEVVDKLVNLFNLEDDAIFTKHDLELTLNNLLVMNQLKFTEKSVGGSFFELSKIIGESKLSEEDLLILQDILKEVVNEEEKLNKVARFLKSISDNVETKEKIDKEVFFIKDASQMTKQLNEPLFYMQVPFKMEDYERPVDLYYRRKKAKDDQDDFTILIALKTKRYQEVKCIIEKHKEQFVINFKLASEEIKAIFEGRAKVLEQQLSEKSVILKFSTQFEEEETFLEVAKQGSIDIKV